MSSHQKFDENDRQRVIAVIERHFGTSLLRLGSYRKYLQDEDGHRYIVIGGYEEWHGIPRKIFDAEAASPGDTTLVIGMRSKEGIDIFSGPFRPLLRHRGDLSVADDNYQFHLRAIGNVLTSREVPSLMLQRLTETGYAPVDRQSAITQEQVFAALDRLSKTERADLVRRVGEQLGRETGTI